MRVVRTLDPQGAEVAHNRSVKEYTEPGATLADFLASPRGRMALLGASRPVEDFSTAADRTKPGGSASSPSATAAAGDFKCVVEQVRVLNFTVDLVLACSIAPLKGKGATGVPGGATTGITVTVDSAEIRGLPGYGAFSRILNVGCVNDIAWRPSADGSTTVSSAARITARGDDTSPIGRGLGAAMEVPLMGGVMRAGVEKALELAIKTSVEGSVTRVTKEYAAWAPDASERVRRNRARGAKPSSMEDAAAAAAADEELRRIRAENAELRRLIAAAEDATYATRNYVPPPPPAPSTPPPPSVVSGDEGHNQEQTTGNDGKEAAEEESLKKAEETAIAMDTFSESDEEKAILESKAVVDSSAENRIIVPSPEPEHVDDDIVKRWYEEVAQLTDEYRRTSQGLYCIKSRRTLTLPIDQRGCPVPFSGWLSDPGRVVGLVYPPTSITRRGGAVRVFTQLAVTYSRHSPSSLPLPL